MSVADAINGGNGKDLDAGATTSWEYTSRCPDTGTETPLYALHAVELLTESGLSAQTILENDIYSTADCEKLQAMLGWRKFNKKNTPALVFSYRDLEGRAVFSRVKPSGSIKLNGKPAKYLSPKGSGIGIYFPEAVRPVLNDASVPLFITEGEKKSLKATQEGFPCIGLGGVACWHTKGSQALHPELRKVAWKGRDVYVVFDSDAVENDMVRRNESKLAAALKKEGAQVRIVRLPGGQNG